MIPSWLHPSVRLFGLWFTVNGVRSLVEFTIGQYGYYMWNGSGTPPLGFWLSNLATPMVEVIAGLWFFFGTRHVISIIMRGRYAAHCCQHCGYDPGPNRPERCPECARAFHAVPNPPASSTSASE